MRNIVTGMLIFFGFCVLLASSLSAQAGGVIIHNGHSVITQRTTSHLNNKHNRQVLHRFQNQARMPQKAKAASHRTKPNRFAPTRSFNHRSRFSFNRNRGTVTSFRHSYGPVTSLGLRNPHSNNLHAHKFHRKNLNRNSAYKRGFRDGFRAGKRAWKRH